jgi:hypothetical protein
MVGNLMKMVSKNEQEEIPAICNFLSIGENNSFSNFPLSQTILGYTFFYLGYGILLYDVAVYNIPSLVIFPVLIMADIGWNISNNCYKPFACIMSLIIGGGLGILWAYLVNNINPEYLYLSIGSNRTACSRPSQQKFKCTLNK